MDKYYLLPGCCGQPQYCWTSHLSRSYRQQKGVQDSSQSWPSSPHCKLLRRAQYSKIIVSRDLTPAVPCSCRNTPDFEVQTQPGTAVEFECNFTRCLRWPGGCDIRQAFVAIGMIFPAGWRLAACLLHVCLECKSVVPVFFTRLPFSPNTRCPRLTSMVALFRHRARPVDGHPSTLALQRSLLLADHTKKHAYRKMKTDCGKKAMALTCVSTNWRAA